LFEIIKAVTSGIDCALKGIQSFFKAVAALVSLLFALWIGSLILSPLLSVAPAGNAISLALSFQDSMDLFAAIVAVASVAGTVVTKNPYVLLGLFLAALLVVFGFGL
jgi:hypothetical protein